MRKRMPTTRNLLRVDQPIIGLNFEVTSEGEYTLMESRSSNVLWREIIRAPFTAGIGDSVIGIKRLPLAMQKTLRW